MRRTYSGNMGSSRQLDTVGVVGSIPIARTIQTQLHTQKVAELPANALVVPAISFRRGRFRLFRVIAETSIKGVKKG